MGPAAIACLYLQPFINPRGHSRVGWSVRTQCTERVGTLVGWWVVQEAGSHAVTHSMRTARSL